MFNIFDYTNYREALSDFYSWKKSTDPKMSHRYIAQRTGFSVGVFSHVVRGKSNIAPDKIIRYAKLMKLSKKENEYFEALVLYEQTKESDRKQQLFEKIMRLNKGDIKPLSFDYYEFYNKWYYSVIREVLDCTHFKNDYARLAKRLRPEITATQAEEAIMLLERLGMIQRDEYGLYRKVDAFVYAGSEEHSFMLKNFVTEMIELGKSSIETPKDERFISWQTISVNSDYYAELVEEVQDFQKRLVAIAEKSKDEDSVYQINMQLFPLTQKL